MYRQTDRYRHIGQTDRYSDVTHKTGTKLIKK